MFAFIKKWRWPFFWASWFVVFLAAELLAVVIDDGEDTLSENVWLLLDWFRGSPGWGPFALAGAAIGFFGVAGWLGIHFFTRKA